MDLTVCISNTFPVSARHHNSTVCFLFVCNDSGYWLFPADLLSQVRNWNFFFFWSVILSWPLSTAQLPSQPVWLSIHQSQIELTMHNCNFVSWSPCSEATYTLETLECHLPRPSSGRIQKLKETVNLDTHLNVSDPYIPFWFMQRFPDGWGSFEVYPRFNFFSNQYSLPSACSFLTSLCFGELDGLAW